MSRRVEISQHQVPCQLISAHIPVVLSVTQLWSGMKRTSYREYDYGFGQLILTMRSAMGLTQAGLAQKLGLSRRSIADWEAGAKYPKAAHLRHLIVLAVAQRAFHAGREAEEIRELWSAARQRELLDEPWLADVLAGAPAADTVLPPDAAPARAELPSPRALPFQPTSFVGRSAELGALARLLANPGCRLLTLHGPGGIGKTRLALAVAAREAMAFPDGVAFVPLASIDRPDQIVSAIGEALQIAPGSHADSTGHLLSALRERRMLLVLDNFEHLLDGAELVAALLAHAPHLTVVVTSRERLNLQAEWLFTVDGLSFPQQHPRAAEAQPSAPPADYSAVALFMQRARQVQPELMLDSAALASVAQICQHVAGMPLAIELAAASVQVLSVAEIERQIRATMHMLATRLRDVPTRHRSMRAVFEHSWRLLRDEEQAALSALAVFRSGWTAEAALQVAGASAELLSALADKSLVRAGRAPEPTAGTEETRFVMLEPIRAYALEQLAVRGEDARVRQSHASYYLALAEAAADEWNTPMKEAAIVRQAREHDNMRAALQWAFDTGNSAIGIRFALALWRYWRSFGHKSEGRAWLAQLLALDEHPADAAAVERHERALHAAAWLASDQYDFATATRLFEQSLALHPTLGDASGKTNLADVLRHAARQARAEGQYAQAAALLEDILARHRVVGDRTLAGRRSIELTIDEVGQVLRELGTVRREQGDFARATALLEQAREVHHAVGDRTSVAFALLGLGDIARDQGDVASLRAACEPGLATIREVGIQWALGFALNNLALAAYYEGDLVRAETLIRESVGLFRANHADTSLSEVLITLGAVLGRRGDVEAACDVLAEALRLAQSVGPRLFAALAMEELAKVGLASGAAERSVRLLAGASALRAEMGTPVRPVDQTGLHQVLATARSTLGDETFERVWAEVTAQPLDQILRAMPGALILRDGRAL
jgi:predicted ATPase/transcriptional regulator with XRE-family HTH domain